MILLIKYPANKLRQHYKNSIYILYQEFRLWVKSLGKILMLIGPTSSGKSTMLLKMLALSPNFKTINRKKIFNQAKSFLQQENSNVEHNYFGQNLVKKTFNLYYESSKKYIFSGCNVIIDDSLYTPSYYLMFNHSMNYYSNIKILLIFNTLEETLEKCIIRNNKFINLIQQYNKIEEGLSDLEAIELTTGNSISKYREPIEIIYRYLEFYSFKPNPNLQLKPLDIIYKNQFIELINKINLEQEKFYQQLLKLKINVTLQYQPIEPMQEAWRIFGNHNKIYI